MNWLHNTVMGIVTVCYLFQAVITVIQLRRARSLPFLVRDEWPLRFPVYLMPHRFGISLSKWITGVWIGGLAFATSMVLLVWLVDEASAEPFLIAMMFCAWAGPMQAWIPKICLLKDEGIEFEQFFPWDAVQRFSINSQCLLLVFKSPYNRTITIPLSGLPQELHATLEGHVAMRTELQTQGAHRSPLPV